MQNCGAEKTEKKGSVMKVLLVDDHALFRAGLRLLVSAVLRNVEVVEASTLGEAIGLVKRTSGLSLCLLDLMLDDGHGIEGVRLFRDAAAEVAVVVVSATQDEETIRACLDAGAMSFVPKSMPPDALTKALRRVLAGQVFLPAPFLSMTPCVGDRSGLSPRQFDVLRALSRGLPTKSIARELNISDNTVKEHLTGLYQALGVRNRTEAVIEAARLGLSESFDG